MSLAKTLIDKACGGVLSRRKLAEIIGEDQAFLSRINAGHAPLPANVAARLAAKAGADPREAVLLAVVSQEKPERRAELARLLGVSTPVDTSKSDDRLYIM